MSNSQLAAFKVFSSLAQMLGVSNREVIPVLDDMFEGGYEDQEYEQGFAWFPNAVTFFPYGPSSNYWVEVYLGDSYAFEDNITYAVSLPFIISEADVIQVGGSDDIEKIQTVNIDRGIYRLIYQERYLTQPEIDSIPVKFRSSDPQSDPWLNLGPKLCKLIFIPTSTQVAAELLKPLEGKNIKLPLFLRKQLT
jgi:hypothetical protein